MTVAQIKAEVTPDRASWRLAGLTGGSCGATLIFPSGDAVGPRPNNPKARHFHPERHDWEAEIA